jgi:hypothetical protein
MPLEKVVTCQLACREARQIRGALIVAIAGDEPPGLFFLTEALKRKRLIQTRLDCPMVLFKP